MTNAKQLNFGRKIGIVVTLGVFLSLFLLQFNIASAAATVTVATGGSSISADSTGGSYTSLTGPIITEGAAGFDKLVIPKDFRADNQCLTTETQEQLAKNNLSKIIYQAVADLKAAEARYQSTTNAFLAQKDAFYAVDLRYEQGLDNSLDYSTAQTNRNRAEIDFILAKYDLIFRAKVIDYYLGKQITF